MAGKPSNMFQGLSVLRAEERKKAQAGSTQQSSAMQEYLKRYADGDGSGGQAAGERRKKKKKPKAAADTGGAIKIIDEDVQGESRARKPPTRYSDEEEEDEDFRPVIANEAEAKLLLKQTQKAKEFYKQQADGSGWVSAPGDDGAARQARGRHDSPDASPPRRTARHGSPDTSPPRRGGRHDSDASPPRRQGRHDSDASPPRRQGRHDSDASPPRRGGRQGSPDASPPRRHGQSNGVSPRHRPAPNGMGARPSTRAARHDSPGASPPRRGSRHNSADASPPRRSAGRAGSPPRRPGGGGGASPARRAARHDSPDASPPRRGGAHDRHDAGQAAKRHRDASPPRRAVKGRHDSLDASPVRRNGRHDSPDASPRRRPADSRQHAADKDISPPRRPGAEGPKMMADGTATGLVTAQVLKAEMDEHKREAEARRLTAAGRGAETVYRDKATGKIVSKQEFEESRRKGKKEKSKEEEEAEQHLEWRGGLAQRRKAEEIAARMAQEAAAPFARYENDRDRDTAFRHRARFGDPMAHLAQDRQRDEPAPITQRYDAQALEQSGFIIPQGVPSHSWLKRGVAAPLNRYNIRPGRHWDGVDRSNGFEKKMFEHLATVRHREQQAREWSMADM